MLLPWLTVNGMPTGMGFARGLSSASCLIRDRLRRPGSRQALSSSRRPRLPSMERLLEPFEDQGAGVVGMHLARERWHAQRRPPSGVEARAVVQERLVARPEAELVADLAPDRVVQAVDAGRLQLG